MDWALFWFWFFQFVNVILGTMRSILTVKANAHTAAVINAASYTLYNITVKMLTGYDMWLVIVSTFVSNMIGVYIGKWICDKLMKDKVWRYVVEPKDEKLFDTVFNALAESGLQFDSFGTTIKLQSTSQAISKEIVRIARKYNCKYYAIEIKERSIENANV